ncbi:hypothetical protein HZS_3951, partial [Henneguya salminicola]
MKPNQKGIEKHILKYVPENLAKQAIEGAQQYQKIIDHLLEQGKIPKKGFENLAIQNLIHSISTLDSNNQIKNAAVGEREARIFSHLVSQRYYGLEKVQREVSLGHGIGRSGDLTEIQPKAAGSSLLYKLTNKLTSHALKLSKLQGVECLVVPMATGMTLALCIRTLAKQRDKARYVIWPRIDQKSCFKSILTAGARFFLSTKGFLPIIIQNKISGDQITTDMVLIKEAIEKYTPASIVCIMTTSSCFAPRAPDKIYQIGELCQKYQIPHLLNNAYGVQVHKYSNLITDTINRSRLDLIVQSTDKNFMVPVGGSIVASPYPDLLKSVSGMYAGRASISPSLDLFITLLEMGSQKYKILLEIRNKNFVELRNRLDLIAKDFSLKLLESPDNHISLGILNFILFKAYKSIIGRRLFFHSVSGCRFKVIKLGDTKIIDGYEFKNWGSHIDNYPCDYLTSAASIGMNQTDIDSFEK